MSIVTRHAGIPNVSTAISSMTTNHVAGTIDSVNSVIHVNVAQLRLPGITGNRANQTVVAIDSHVDAVDGDVLDHIPILEITGDRTYAGVVSIHSKGNILQSKVMDVGLLNQAEQTHTGASGLGKVHYLVVIAVEFASKVHTVATNRCPLDASQINVLQQDNRLTRRTLGQRIVQVIVFLVGSGVLGNDGEVGQDDLRVLINMGKHLVQQHAILARSKLGRIISQQLQRTIVHDFRIAA